MGMLGKVLIFKSDLTGTERCGVTYDIKPDQPAETECCGEQKANCDFRYGPTGPAADDFFDFIRDEEIWLGKYHEAWTIATENGHPVGAL